MSWVPTESFLKGKIIKPFLPSNKIPDYANSHIRNLYPGDDVYIFETKGDKWARGYVLSKPFPRDYTIISVNLDELPTPQIRVLVFPLKYVKIIETIPFTKSDDNAEDSESGLLESASFMLNAINKDKKAVPSLPPNTTLKRTLQEEIKTSLEFLNAHIYSLYSIGEFRLFGNLVDIFYKLHEARIKLMHNLLTKNEAQFTKELATQLLNRIPKRLGSKTERLNATNYDLEHEHSDVSGYKAIFARDALSGEILTDKIALPARIALNNELCALVGNFPIHAHNNLDKYSIKAARNKKFALDLPSNILVDFKSVSGSSGYLPPGFAGMTAYMYLRNTKKRLTEAFAVHAESVEELANVEKLSAALFKNIPHHETCDTRVYLVAVLTEEIDLKVTQGGHETTKRVRRGIAAGVTDISRVFSGTAGNLTTGNAYHFHIKLYGSFMPYNKTFQSQDGIDRVSNNGWGELADRIIGGTSNGVAVNPRAEKLVITVKEFRHQFEAVEKIHSINQTPISRINAIFYDPLAEVYERIYLYMGKIKLVNAANKDDLLTVEVSIPNNESITFCKASNQQGKRQWQFISVNPDEEVGEIVRINGIAVKPSTSNSVPKEDHVLLSLYVNGVYSGDGKVLYKSGSRLVEFKKGHNVEILSCTTGAPIAHVEIKTEYVGKYYNSDTSIDKIFQYEKLLKSSSGIEELIHGLTDFCRVEQAQLLKFFSELMMSLNGIIDTCLVGHGQLTSKILDRSFYAVVHLLDGLFGKSDENLTVIESFCNKCKGLQTASIFILSRLTEAFKHATTVWDLNSRAVCRILSVSMRLSISATKFGSDLTDYYITLNNLFAAVTGFLSIDSRSLANDQTLVLNIVDYVLSFRVNIPEGRILNLVVGFIDAVGVRGLGAKEQNLEDTAPGQSVKDHELIISKLLLILRLVSSNLFVLPEVRHSLLANSVRWAMEALNGSTDMDASRLACSILNAVCMDCEENLRGESPSEQHLAICRSLVKYLPAIANAFTKYNKYTRGNEYFRHNRTFTTLFPTTYPFNEFSIDSIVNDEVLVELLLELATVFASIAKIGKKLAGDEGYAKIINDENELDFFKPEAYLIDNFEAEDIISILTGVRWMRIGGYFPQDRWLSIFSVIIEGCTCALELVRPLILKHIPSVENVEDFDIVLWGNYLRNLLKLAVLAPVAVEYLSDIPRYACSSITFGLRDRISVLVKEAWTALGWEASNAEYSRFGLRNFAGYQVEFIDSAYGIIPDLILFALQRNGSCQAIGVEILYCLIAAEYTLSDNIDEIEKQTLDTLRELYYRHAYKPTVAEQKNFISLLRNAVSLDPLDPACEVITKFIDTLERMFKLLNDFITVPIGHEFDPDRAYHGIEILAFLKKYRPELYIAFVNGWYEANLARQDFVQCAFSLELIASVYEWDHNTLLPPLAKPKFPEQSAFQRKEALYNMIATNYIKGKNLSGAIDTYNELLDMYRKHTYDLKSFAYVHNKLSKLYMDFDSSDDISPAYFRLEAIGDGFPKYLTGARKIYQAAPFEHITSVNKFLLTIFPGVTILNSEEEAQHVRDTYQQGRYMLNIAVDPAEEINDKVVNTSVGARKYAKSKDLRFFTSTKRLPGSTSITDLWTEETHYQSLEPFPNLRTTSIIIDMKVVRLSPLDNALRAIINKNNELATLEISLNKALKEKLDYSTLMQDLSRQLAGTVDSPVNGGVGQYRVFYSDSTYEESAEDLEKIQLLKSAFADLVIILHRCLNLHGKLVLPSMLMTHNALVELFKKNFSEEIETLSLSQETSQSQSYTKNARYSVFVDRKPSSMLDVGSELTQSTSNSNLGYKGLLKTRGSTTASSSLYGGTEESILSAPTVKLRTTADTDAPSNSAALNDNGVRVLTNGADLESTLSTGSSPSSPVVQKRSARRWRYGDIEL